MTESLKIAQLHGDGWADAELGPCSSCGMTTNRAYPSYAGLVRLCNLSCREALEKRILEGFVSPEEDCIFLKKQAD